ncbi:UPF0175 family protein [Promineifilum sp.]|uniref:UPF0175 family protein n=1 Tax=Promineifilum sp. TaxID=2664178 RepID=UPI0035ADB2A9
MTEKMHNLSILYPDDLLLSLKKSQAEFEAEARLLLAVKLYEIGRVSTGMAARLARMDQVSFLFALGRLGLSPLDRSPDELMQDATNA